MDVHANALPDDLATPKWCGRRPEGSADRDMVRQADEPGASEGGDPLARQLLQFVEERLVSARVVEARLASLAKDAEWSADSGDHAVDVPNSSKYASANACRTVAAAGSSMRDTWR